MAVGQTALQASVSSSFNAYNNPRRQVGGGIGSTLKKAGKVTKVVGKVGEAAGIPGAGKLKKAGKVATVVGKAGQQLGLGPNIGMPLRSRPVRVAARRKRR